VARKLAQDFTSFTTGKKLKVETENVSPFAEKAQRELKKIGKVARIESERRGCHTAFALYACQAIV
jgi:hypothetical protein